MQERVSIPVPTTRVPIVAISRLRDRWAVRQLAGTRRPNTATNPGGTAYNGYQSPYNNPAGGYRTADSRSTYGMTGGTAPTNPYPGSAAPQPWNSAGNNAMGSGPVAPAGYGAPPAAPSQPAFGPGGSSPTATPSWNTSAPANSGYSAPAAGYSSPTSGTGSAGLTRSAAVIDRVALRAMWPRWAAQRRDLPRAVIRLPAKPRIPRAPARTRPLRIPIRAA